MNKIKYLIISLLQFLILIRIEKLILKIKNNKINIKNLKINI